MIKQKIMFSIMLIFLLILVGCKGEGKVDEYSKDVQEQGTTAVSLETTVTETSYFEYIMSHTDEYPRLTKEEFISVVKGKTTLTFLDFPAEKSCILTMGERCECFIIENNFLLVIGDESIFKGENQEQETAAAGFYCSLGYYEDGILKDSIVTVARFKDFINAYSG